jgi:predicted chitinase
LIETTVAPDQDEEEAEPKGFITKKEFDTCVQVFDYKAPDESIFQSFNNRSSKDGGITSKLEALMAVVQFAHESAGFTAKREWACSEGRWEPQCNTYDRKGCPGQYYGRGFIQLSHCYNYRPASLEMFGDDRLVTNPDLVAEDDDTAMATALWFWKKRVHDKGGSEGAFGMTTCAINCGWDCLINPNIGRIRWEKFKICLQQTGNDQLEVTENGCYN